MTIDTPTARGTQLICHTLERSVTVAMLSDISMDSLLSSPATETLSLHIGSK